VFFRVVDGSNSVVKHDKKDKRHVKKIEKGRVFIIGQFFVFRYNQMLRISRFGLKSNFTKGLHGISKMEPNKPKS